MAHLTIKRRDIHRIEKTLLKLIKKSYAPRDMYVVVEIEAFYQDNNNTCGTIKVGYGEYSTDGKIGWQKNVSLILFAVKPSIVLGQFIQAGMQDE